MADEDDIKRVETNYLEGITPRAGSVQQDIDLDQHTFTPWEGRFLVRRFEPDEITSGGLVIPDMAKKEKCWGKVEALPSKGIEGVAIGDTVLFVHGAGTELDDVLGKGFLLLDYHDDFDNDVLGIFRSKKGLTEAVPSA